MRTFPLAVAAVLLVLVALPQSVAQTCPTTSPSLAIPSGNPAQPYLLALNSPVAHGIALYKESNGEAGLQRNDAGHDDTCAGFTPRDTIVAVLKLL